jgi:hypothetical protein
MRSALLLIVALLLLAPSPARAAPTTDAWQVYTVASGLRDNLVTAIAPDGSGAVWAGTFAGGRGFPHAGQLAQLAYDGGGRAISAEALEACPAVLGMAASGLGLWLRLGGYHDYVSADFRGTCVPRYGAAIGLLDESGALQMLPKELLPADITAGPVADSISRPWFGTPSGVVVREHDGTWRPVPIWGPDEGGTTAVRAYGYGAGIAAGSARGGIALIELPAGEPERLRLLQRPPAEIALAVTDLDVGPSGVGAILGARFLVQQNVAAVRWDVINLPEGAEGATRLAYVGGALYLGTWPGGLYRLDASGATAIRAGETPLPGDSISDLKALGSSLYIATDRGVARLNTTAPWPDPYEPRRAFDELWRRSNRAGQGSWVWGPRAWAERYEPSQESPGGYRMVRYYDKTRMELSLSGEGPDSPWYVTNGLLVSELVRGEAQYGLASIQGCPGYTPRPCQATVPVAGDPENNPAPWYGAFEPYLGPAPGRVGERVGAIFTPPESQEQNAALATEPTTIAAYDEVTGHNVPQVFWRFMGRQPGGWLYVFGHPISEAYWVRARVRGVEQWVLVQLFERRTLTYTPANPAEWQVEMGNVGQHYYQWRYGPPVGEPWAQGAAH